MLNLPDRESRPRPGQTRNTLDLSLHGSDRSSWQRERWGCLSSPHECRSLGIDHEWTYDDSGIWKRSYQQILEYGLIGGEVSGGVVGGWETRSRPHAVASIDSSVRLGIVASGR